MNKEQEAFIAGKPGGKGEATAPWVGAPNEDALREECLALSTVSKEYFQHLETEMSISALKLGLKFSCTQSGLYALKLILILLFISVCAHSSRRKFHILCKVFDKLAIQALTQRVPQTLLSRISKRSIGITKLTIVLLLQDRRNFVRAPPPGVDFAWDFDAVQPVAQATLALDPNLETMRFELVPKV